MGSPECRAVQKCNVVLVKTIKINIDRISDDLFGENLITSGVKDGMSLDRTPEVKAGNLLDCVRTQVDIESSRVHDFIAVLRRNGGDNAAKALEGKILERTIHNIMN